MFNEEEQQLPTELTVQDLVIGLQILERANSAGVIKTNEYATVGIWRNKLTAAIAKATGKNIDAAVEASE